MSSSFKEIFDEINAAFSSGDCKYATELIDHYLSLSDNPENRYSLFKLRGTMETMLFHPFFKVNSFSSALYEAEQTLNPSFVASAYMDIAMMFNNKYIPISISFIRKAETIFKVNKDENRYKLAILNRALSSFFLYMNFQNDGYKVFYDEAVSIVNSVSRNDLEDEQSKHYYDLVKGQVLRDDTLLLRLFNDSMKSNNTYETISLGDCLLGIYCEKGQWKKASDILAIYKSISQLYAYTNQSRKDHIIDLENKIKNGLEREKTRTNK